MNTTDLFLNPRTKLLRSGWRAAAFLALLTLPQWVISLVFTPAKTESGAAFEVNLAMIFTYAVLITWVGVVSWLCLRFLEHLGLRSIGFGLHRNWWREVLTGFIISAATIALVVGLQAVSGGTRIAPNPAWWTGSGINAAGLFLIFKEVLLALGLLILAGAFEELMYRGYAFQTLLRGAPAIVPILLLSIYFAYGHWENPSRTFFSTVNTVLAGVWLSLAYLKTRSLWLPTALHFGWNWTMGAVFGLPVSGLLIPQHPLLISTCDAPLWLTGGSYGPEGGAAATIFIIASTVLIWRAKWLGISPEV